VRFAPSVDRPPTEAAGTGGLHRRLFDEAPVALAWAGTDLHIQGANRALGDLLGLEPASLVGRPLGALSVSPSPARLGLMAGKALSQAKTVWIEHRFPRATGGDGWARTSLRRVEIEGETVLVVALEDHTGQREALEAQRAEAERDPLTGLLNRRGADRRLSDALARLSEIGPVAVLLCDVDDFKAVNDTFGHSAGDRVLVSLAGRLRSAVRSGDEVARRGGDEFLVVARVTGQDEARAVAERCVRTAGAPLRAGEGPARVTVSVGVAVAGPPAKDDQSSRASRAAQLFEQADRALYESKARGGNCWSLGE
jgi:diguanylate cyclase (GGDEF)-like protein/PAS domain S-box-containing protein